MYSLSALGSSCRKSTSSLYLYFIFLISLRFISSFILARLMILYISEVVLCLLRLVLLMMCYSDWICSLALIN